MRVMSWGSFQTPAYSLGRATSWVRCSMGISRSAAHWATAALARIIISATSGWESGVSWPGSMDTRVCAPSPSSTMDGSGRSMMTAPRAMRAFCQTRAKSLPQASMVAQGAAGVVRLRGLTGGQGVEDGLGVVIGQVGGQAHPCGPGLAGKGSRPRPRCASAHRRPGDPDRPAGKKRPCPGLRASCGCRPRAGRCWCRDGTRPCQGLAERPAGGRAGQGQGQVEAAVVRGQDVERVVHVAGGGAVDTDEGQVADGQLHLTGSPLQGPPRPGPEAATSRRRGRSPRGHARNCNGRAPVPRP